MSFEVLRRLALVITDVSEEYVASIIRVTRLSTVTDKLDCGGALVETLFAVRREAYSR
jgi:hypothetical protein